MTIVDTSDQEVGVGQQIQINVNPPQLSSPSSVTLKENTSLTFSGGNVIDATDTAGNGNDNELLSLSVGNGALKPGDADRSERFGHRDCHLTARLVGHSLGSEQQPSDARLHADHRLLRLRRFTYEAQDSQATSRRRPGENDHGQPARPDGRQRQLQRHGERHAHDQRSGRALSNDTDPNSLTLTAVSFTNPSHGTLTPDANGDGGFVYKPATGYYGSDSFTYEAQDSQATSSPATVTITVNPPLGLLLLDPSGSGALDDTGSGSISVSNGGAVVVDSNNATAAILSGAGGVNASTIDVTGGTKVTGSGKFSSTVVHAAPIADPLGLSLPAAPSTTFSAVNYSGKATLTLSPGTYVGGIKITGSGSVMLLPGVYYMKGGGFSITGSGSVTGAGVLLINAPSKSTDSISLTGSGNMTLSPSSSLTGAYASYDGITICRIRRRGADQHHRLGHPEHERRSVCPEGPDRHHRRRRTLGQ